MLSVFTPRKFLKVDTLDKEVWVQFPALFDSHKRSDVEDLKQSPDESLFEEAPEWEGP